MQVDYQRAYWLEVGGLALASVLLFRFGLLGLVFLVPIQLAWIRRGEEAGWIASGAFLVGIAAFALFDLIRLRREAGPEGVFGGLVLLNLVFALGFLLGLFALNSRYMAVTAHGARRELGVAERMLAAVGLASVIYGPAIAWIASSGAARTVITTMIELWRPLFESAGASSDEVQAFTDLVIQAMLSGLLFGFFLLLVGNWWLGTVLAFKSRFPLPEGNPVMARLSGLELTDFRLPAYLVWALIGTWGGVLLSMVVELGWFAFVVWNFAFVMLALYGIQGIAIIWHWLDRRTVQRGARIAIAVAIVFGLMIPGLRLVVGLGVPGLGVSELWIDYHRLKGSEEAQ